MGNIMFDYLFYAHAKGLALGAVRQASSARIEIDQVNLEVSQLESALHRYAVANQALWEIVSSRLDVTEDDLRAQIESVERRQEEQAKQPPQLCPHCHRPCGVHRTTCMYCGEEIGPVPIFEA